MADLFVDNFDGSGLLIDHTSDNGLSWLDDGSLVDMNLVTISGGAMVPLADSSCGARPSLVIDPTVPFSVELEIAVGSLAGGGEFDLTLSFSFYELGGSGWMDRRILLEQGITYLYATGHMNDPFEVTLPSYSGRTDLLYRFEYDPNALEGRVFIDDVLVATYPELYTGNKPTGDGILRLDMWRYAAPGLRINRMTIASAGKQVFWTANVGTTEL